jgi:AcrR family transcriptional regulator
MGIRPGSLYAAFGDKRSLFHEVVEAYGRSPAGEFIWAAMAREPTAFDAFRRILIDGPSAPGTAPQRRNSPTPRTWPWPPGRGERSTLHSG